MPTKHGPYGVAKGPVNTGLMLAPGDEIRTVARGIVDFGGAVLGVGAPKLNANGDDWATPDDYPAPELRKNSLICEVGALQYQGGTDQTFTVSEEGPLVLLPNDRNPSDNSRGWTVTIYRKAA